MIRALVLFCGLLLASHAGADGLRIVELSFSTGQRQLVTLFESLGVLHIRAGDLPAEALDGDALAAREVVLLPGCGRCYRLDDLGRYEENARTASATLTLQPALVKARVLSAREAAPVTPVQTQPALALGYLVRGLREDTRDARPVTHYAIEPRLDVGFGRYGSLTSTGVVGDTLSQRGDTLWRYYDVGRQQRLAAGDAISMAGTIGSAVRLGGVQIARDFTLSENYLNRPFYNLGGQTALPATLDVFVDGQRRFSDQVASGQYEVRDLDVNTAGSDVELVLTNVLGEREVVRTRLFGNAFRLPQGVSDFSFEAGAPRRGENLYQGYFAAGTWRYGFRPWLAGEAHVESGDGDHVLGSGALSAATDWGSFLIGGGVAGRRQDDHRETGSQGRLSWAFNRQIAGGLRLGATLDASVSDNFLRYAVTQPSPTVYRAGLLASWRGLALRTGYTDAGGLRSLQGELVLARPPFILSASTQYFLDDSNAVTLLTASWQPARPQWLPNVDYRHAFLNTGAVDTVRVGDYLPASRSNYGFSGSRQTLNDGSISDQGSVNLNQTFDDVQASYLFQQNRDSQLQSLSLASAVVFHDGRPYVTSYLGERQGYVAAQTGVSGLRISHGLVDEITDAHGVAVFTIPAFSTVTLALDATSLPPGYRAGVPTQRVAVSADSQAAASFAVDHPGFFLRIPGYAGDSIVFNGRTFPYGPRGAYVLSGRVGDNELVWGERHRRVRLSRLRPDSPVYILSEDGYLMRLIGAGGT